MLNKINITSDKQKLIIYIVLILAVLAVYWQVNKCSFVNMDDYSYVTDNHHIQSGVTPDGIRWAFTTKFFGLWHPLIWLSFMFDYQLHGLNPGGYHLTNLILHILSTLLLFRLFCRMTGAIWKSAFVASLFALHPLHVESVAWIAERKDVLSAFFWMLTLCLYVYYTEKPVIRRYLLVVFSFVCALMSKPMVVTLPLIMILLDYWPLNRFESRKDNRILWQLKEKLPFFILSVILVIITLYHPNKTESSSIILPFGSRLANAPVAFITYLVKTFWPHNLAVFYPFPDQLPFWSVIGSTLLIMVVSAAVIVKAKRFPYLFTGWFWYIITLLPVLGIMQISFYALADRYTYLPLIGIGIGLAWGIPSLIKNENICTKILFPAVIAVIAVTAILAWKQCSCWRDSFTLHSHALQVTKNNFLAYNGLGNALSEAGNVEDAVYYYNEALRLKPNFADPYNNRGNVYLVLGRYQPAVENYTEAIRLKSGNATIYNNRGNAYLGLGLFQQALKDFNEAMRLKPDNADAYNNRGIAYLVQGNRELGCPDAKKACELGDCRIWKDSNERGDCR